MNVLFLLEQGCVNMKMIRDVTKEEYQYLDKDIKKGEIVYEYYGHTYGCIGPKGIAITFVKGETPFYEVPIDSVGE